MICIPRAIRPHKNYPVKLNETDILAYSFIRETEENFYIQEDLDINDFIRKIVPANTSKTDIFEYSVYLYGYYNEKHVGIRNKSFSFPLFFKANKLYNMPIIYDDESYCKMVDIDRKNKRIVLVSINKEHKDIIVDDVDRLKTVGRVILK